MTVYGTRPEAIKVAPVVQALQTDNRFDSITVVTGQHREMLDQVNAVFGISPDYDLNVFAPGQALNELMAKSFSGLDPVLSDCSPDAVLVQGDTSTAAAASIAAFYRNVPVVHLEAGLRSGSISSPFPEEGNRRITAQISALHLAPTLTSRQNLIRESFLARDIVVTGNTVIDALLQAVSHDIEINSNERLARSVAEKRPLLLVTTHRRENWRSMAGVGVALKRLAFRYPDMDIVLPAHRNPIVREAILPQLRDCANVITTEPLPYGEFTQVMKASRIILTDSGGVQEEAPALGKPVLVMRDNTERPEAVSAGTVRLIGTGEQRIVDEVSQLLDDPKAYALMANAVNPYGDGRAAERSIAAIAELLGVGTRLPDFTGGLSKGRV